MERSKLSRLPPVLMQALHKLGADIRDARRRRRIPTTVMAERAMISRTTLYKIERGDPKVDLGFFAMVLYVLGMMDRFADIADARFDLVGLALDEEHLPQRIHSKSARKSSKRA